jgi:hypothetical protein
MLTKHNRIGKSCNFPTRWLFGFVNLDPVPVVTVFDFDSNCRALRKTNFLLNNLRPDRIDCIHSQTQYCIQGL